MIKQTKTKLECPTCEQPYAPNDVICPHCRNEIVIGLDMSPSEHSQLVEELRARLEKNENDKDIIKELSKLIYFEAMKLRYDNPSESLTLFNEVVELKPDHWEARLKVSWLSIRFTKNEAAVDALLPVVATDETTSLQKQRAYTNLSCAENWKEKGANFELAEKWARDGIALDGEGTSKLWENLATALKNQGKLEDARTSFKHAIKLNPKSLNAIERQASIDRHLKIQKKQPPAGQQQQGAGNKKFHLKSPREYFGKKPPKDFVKI